MKLPEFCACGKYNLAQSGRALTIDHPDRLGQEVHNLWGCARFEHGRAVQLSGPDAVLDPRPGQPVALWETF